MRQAAFILKVEIRPFPEFAHRMAGEEFRRRPLGGSFPGDGLDAVLAELERGRMFRIRPGAARAIEPVRLVHVEESPGSLTIACWPRTASATAFNAPHPAAAPS